MATNTYKSYLMKGTGTGTITYAKLVDIKNYPDMGQAPDMLETTTLSDAMRTYILGLQDTGALTFTCNYTASDYTTLAALTETETDYALYLGSTSGSDGKFSFKGFLSVRLLGKGVNEVREMEITIAPSTAITFAAA